MSLLASYCTIFIPNSILGLLLSFLLFRFFDITKLYPVNKAEKISGAIGVLADDIVAGLMTAGIIIFLNIFGIDFMNKVKIDKLTQKVVKRM